jgi:hypothetical protein
MMYASREGTARRATVLSNNKAEASAQAGP